jgi:hypothetical protein
MFFRESMIRALQARRSRVRDIFVGDSGGMGA